MRRFFRRLFRLGVLAGIAYGVWRYLEKQRDERGVSWESQPFPYPPGPRAADTGSSTGATGGNWVEPNGDACPSTHPVKAKLSSKIFHIPGGANYERTVPDRCYRDAAAAEEDGLRQAAR